MGLRARGSTWQEVNKRYRAPDVGQVRKHADGSDMAAVNLRNIDDPGIVADVPIRLFDGASTWKSLDERPQPFLLQSPES